MEQHHDEYLDNPEAANNSRAAAEVVNEVLKRILDELKPGKNVYELCVMGDNEIMNEVGKVRKKVKQKGVAFPTCINVNQIVAHNSEVDTKQNYVLQQNDVVRVDLGVHIDGYIAVAAQTIVLTNETIVGKPADCIAAADCAINACLRLMKPGCKNTELSDVIGAIAAEFDVSAVEGVLCHQMKRYVIDGNQTALTKPTEEHQVDEFEFKPYETYQLDMVFTTGKSTRLFEGPKKPTIYKRSPEVATPYFNTKAAQHTYTNMRHFNDLPFSIRALENPMEGRLGINELYNNRVVDRFPILMAKRNDFVVHLKTTVHILPSQVKSVTGIPTPQPFQATRHLQNPAVLDLLNKSL
eukprot:CAMPEP_0117430154 /NCGR_PEP_ID=MMETSP0758-20121206/9669_1 /TAXON_ID=63605 /ORGANISM="Percolomonas cosmopolitus, Strain AE-1 (ATCC 50343)" /LENGTH=352 /DNA_ID=CAMNT_0005217841 /DNA_START=27 /DNA_END=1082 /DNA_ORIENTATION=-